MTFGAEKRRLLGWLALLAPIPLPFNQVIAWPELLLFLAVVAGFLARAREEEARWLPVWMMNLLAVAYLPVLFLDLSSFRGGQLLRPLIHLAMFALAVKLFSLRRDRDIRQAYLGIFFLTLAAVGSSVHPSMMLYLVASVALNVFAMTRLAGWDALADFGHVGTPWPAGRLRGFAGLSTLAALVLAVPLFVLLPRIRNPYIVGTAPGAANLLQATSFTSEIGLDAIGRLRVSRAVALRFESLGPGSVPGERRFKVETYDAYSDARWRRSEETSEVLQQQGADFFRLTRGVRIERLHLWLSPMGAPQLPRPLHGFMVRATEPRLFRDRGGGLRLPRIPAGTFEYEVDLGRVPDSLADPPELGGSDRALLSRSGIDARVAELARRAAGEGGDRERADRLEAHLLREYAYTLDFLGRGGATPIEDFLFENRRGHCELFATSLVLLLRAEGIPARLVTGFLGAELNPIQDYWVVRQSHRHAWVEAWIEGEGWQTLDPTPPAGRPGSESGSLGAVFGQAWDWVIFRWDRYVLTYGMADQIQAFFGLRDLWLRMREMFESDAPALEEPVPEPAPAFGESPPTGAEPRSELTTWWAAVPLVLAFAAVLVWWLRRPRLDATLAYRRLRRWLATSFAEVTPATPPLALAEILARRHPAAEEPGGRIVGLYLRESFAGVPTSEEELAAVAEWWRVVERILRQER